MLNSCEGARGLACRPLLGSSRFLVHCGVPAVFGMQFEITDEAAIAFAGRLYDALARNFPVDAALAQARRSIFAAGNDIEFGTPVLFLRGRMRAFSTWSAMLRPSAIASRYRRTIRRGTETSIESRRRYHSDLPAMASAAVAGMVVCVQDGHAPHPRPHPEPSPRPHSDPIPSHRVCASPPRRNDSHDGFRSGNRQRGSRKHSRRCPGRHWILRDSLR